MSEKEELKRLALEAIDKGDDILDFPDGQLILSWQHKENKNEDD